MHSTSLAIFLPFKQEDAYYLFDYDYLYFLVNNMEGKNIHVNLH